jgi:ceramide glucosyltransferase
VMAWVIRLVVALSAFATVYQLFGLVAAATFFRQARRRAARAKDYRPPVTILKPLKGRGIDLYANLASFCRQEYPQYQIVFGVSDPDDPAVEIVERIRRDFPQRDIVLSIGNRPGANRKVASLCHMIEHAKHPILALSDADIRVRPDYLRRVVAPLADPKVGVTTCLYRGRGFFGLPTVIESLFINTDFVPQVLTAHFLGMRNALGASIAFKREALDRMGGFPVLADYLADDNVLGERIKGLGYEVVLLPFVVETILDSNALGDVWRHQVRWASTYRICEPIGWFASIVTHAVAWGVAAFVVTGGSPLGWALLVAAIASRLGTLRAIMRMLHERDTPRHLWMVPLKDLGSTAVWLASWLGHEVMWSGQRLRIQRDGRMVLVQARTGVAALPAVAPVPPIARGETDAA